MAPARLFEQNVRPARVSDMNHDDEASVDSEGPSDESGEDDAEDGSSDSQNGDIESDGEIGLNEYDGKVEQEISGVSFGALRQAQDTLSRKRKRGSDVTAEQEEKLDALRSRLKDIRSQAKTNGSTLNQERKGNGSAKYSASSKVTAGANGQKDAGATDEDDSDSAPSEEGAPAKARTSKHAPTSQSSRHQVTRKRVVVDVPKKVVRDPRFDALQQTSTTPGNPEKAYSFLRDYQKTEIAELKSAIKQARNKEDKETLRRKLISMENRIKSEDAKQRQQDILRQHRKEEKEKVQQGKKPFYLKQKDLKERALVEKFKGMKSKDREKLMEKRRRKEDQKEKKRMPDARRVAG